MSSIKKSTGGHELEELENELFSSGDGEDAYTKDVREKTDRKLIVSNFLESKA